VCFDAVDCVAGRVSGADLHMAQLFLTATHCLLLQEIQIGY